MDLTESPAEPRMYSSSYLVASAHALRWIWGGRRGSLAQSWSGDWCWYWSETGALRRSPLWRPGCPASLPLLPAPTSRVEHKQNILVWIRQYLLFYLLHHFLYKWPKLISVVKKSWEVVCQCLWEKEHSTLRTVQPSTHTITAYHCNHKILLIQRPDLSPDIAVLIILHRYSPPSPYHF